MKKAGIDSLKIEGDFSTKEDAQEALDTRIIRDISDRDVFNVVEDVKYILTTMLNKMYSK